MNRNLQIGMIVAIVMLSVPLASLVNSRTPRVQPKASDTSFHASFSPGKDVFSCIIDDIPHIKTLHPGEKVTLRAGISVGSGTYSIKWKAQDKLFDTSAVDAEGLGTFADSGTPVSTTNPTIWFAPSAFRDTTQIEIRLFVTDKQRPNANTVCSVLYTTNDTEEIPTPTQIPTGTDVKITMPVLNGE